MQVELIGCTGAGKSTLARCLIQAFRAHGLQAWAEDEFVLRQMRLNWIEGRLVRTLLVDICSLLACLIALRDSGGFFVLLVKVIARLPVAVPWTDKLNLARNGIKRIGIYEIVRRRASSREIVVVDEGTLNLAHGLFVHLLAKARTSDLSTFARIVPLPDMTIYLTRSESILIERTLERGHKRIRDCTSDNVERFIKRALHVIDTVVQQLLLGGRLQEVDGTSTILVRQDYRLDQLFALVPGIIREQADVIARHASINASSPLRERRRAPLSRVSNREVR